MTESPDHGLTILQIGHMATRARRQDLLAAFARRYGWVVQSGPFAGQYCPNSSPGATATFPKLLGCYGSELHTTIAGISRPHRI